MLEANELMKSGWAASATFGWSASSGESVIVGFRW